MQYKLQCHKESLLNVFISYFSLKQFLEDHILNIKQIWRVFKKCMAWHNYKFRAKAIHTLILLQVKFIQYIFFSVIFCIRGLHISGKIFIFSLLLFLKSDGILIYKDFIHTILSIKSFNVWDKKPKSNSFILRKL